MACISARPAQSCRVRAVYWEGVATRDADIALQIQHYAMALALLQAGRALRPDHELERIVGFGVARAHRALEARLAALRGQCAGVPPPSSLDAPNAGAVA